jgi:hypothetical protein
MSNQENYGEIENVVIKSFYKYKFILSVTTDKYLLEMITGGDKDNIYRYNPLSKEWYEHEAAEISNIDIKKLSDFDFDSDSDSDYVYDFNSEIEENRKTYLEEEGGYLTGFHNRDYCDEDCRGWNGFNKRCDCGNRRVYWTDGLCYEAE